jgi:hypothetical protein
MKFQATDILGFLQQNLSNNIGRHLYAVLGTYSQLDKFTKTAINHAKQPNGEPFPKPISLNQVLLDSFDPDSLQEMIHKELKRPQNTQDKLNRAFDEFLRISREETKFLILKDLELLFAYSLDVSRLRLWASNQQHLLILLPGENRSDQIYLFPEVSDEESFKFDNQLFSENNIWELSNE